jgi:hypothetical protein
MGGKSAEAIHQEHTPIPVSEFLESIPPGSLTLVEGLTEERHYPSGALAGYVVATPEIQIHCPSDSCNGIRFFRADKTRKIPDLEEDEYSFFYLTYVCSNCRKHEKTFSLAAARHKDSLSGECYKFGE